MSSPYLDCFVASLLPMTQEFIVRRRLSRPKAQCYRARSGCGGALRWRAP